MSYDDVSDARARTTTPGVLLIVTGALNLLTALGMLFFGLAMLGATSSPEFKREFKRGFDEEMAKNKDLSPEELETAKSIGKGFEQGMYASGPGLLIWGALALLSGILILVGGVALMRAQAYGLSAFAAVLALLPCSSPCCLFGAIGGILALMVLMNPEVKAAFR